MMVLSVNEWLQIENLRSGKYPKLFMTPYHGFAIAKKHVFHNIKKGDAGLLTAYIPEDKIFSIKFPDQWHTFQQTKEWFLQHFEIIWV